jgi:GT2 family glycosyltransferase
VTPPDSETLNRRLSLRVSVIIPTKYRPEDVAATVRTIFAQSMLPIEAIVVDQSLDDEIGSRLRAEVRKAADPARCDRILLHLHDPSIPGLSAARNRAMDVASGNIWLFLDDDVLLEPEFIENLLDAYRRYPTADGVSGVFTNYVRPPLAFRAWARIFLTGPFHDERQPIYWSADRLRDSKPLPARKVTGALMSFRAAAVGHLRFDEKVHGPDDADFCAQLPRGTVLLVNPAARLFHKRSSNGRSRLHWIEVEVERATYLFLSNWATGVANYVRFGWLMAGYCLATVAASTKRVSVGPFRGLLNGFLAGREQARNRLAH